MVKLSLGKILKVHVYFRTLKNLLPVFSFLVHLNSNAEDFMHVSHAWVAQQVEEIESKAKDGDLIFQYDQSLQSPATAEVQKNNLTHVGLLFKEHNKWYIYEAVGPVMKTPLRAFLFYTRDYRISIKRLPKSIVDLSIPKNIQKLKLEFKKYIGLDYDYIFQWGDETIYCSELVYKMFDSAFSIQIGKLVPIGSLNIDGPLAQHLIEARKQFLNGDSYLNELIVTPASMADDKKLKSVYDSF